MENIARILEINQVTHDVKSFKIEKPSGYSFIPGQATDVSVNKPGWEKELRPFTFTCLNDQPYLEFTIKRYADHKGVTDQVHRLNVGDGLIIRDVWGAIAYKGPGYFIAGGAGITPFIAILRQLHNDNKLQGNKLIFANKTSADIIYKKELTNMLGNDFINVLSKEHPLSQNGNTLLPKNSGYRYGIIDEAFLLKEISSFSTHFYVCGPDKMIADINGILKKNGADPEQVVFEK